MSDLNLPPDEQADHSGPVVDADAFDGSDDDDATGGESADGPQPGTVAPPD